MRYVSDSLIAVSSEPERHLARAEADIFQIYKYLLVLPDGITVDHTEKQLLDGDPKSDTGRPSVAILQTCKCIDSEATPILYAQNKFTFRLSMCTSLASSLASTANISPVLGTGPVANSFILNGLRWSTISCLSSISFLSNNAPLSDQQVGPIAGPYISSRPRPRFTCSGADIIARFTEYDLKYSPTGPNRYMVLSIYNWVSLQVMREELSEFQSELEAMMGPG